MFRDECEHVASGMKRRLTTDIHLLLLRTQPNNLALRIHSEIMQI